MTNSDHSDIIFKTVIGSAINLAAFITSVQEQIEWYLRIASLLVGITVGVLTAISVIRKMRQSDKSDKDDPDKD